MTELAPYNKMIRPEEFIDAYEDAADERRQTQPPIRMSIPRGSVALRDWRVWHRGVSNESDQPRHMLGVSYLSNDVRGEPLFLACVRRCGCTGFL